MHSPHESHMGVIYKILCYLKSTPGKGILFQKMGNIEVEAYNDVDWVGSIVNRRSTSRYCTFLGGNLATWRSKKQPVVARSSTEAEFKAIAQGICELLWIKIILINLGITLKEPMRLYCDNQAAINIAHNPNHHDQTKHVEIDRHFIKEKLDIGLICTPYVPSSKQLADILTKGQPSSTFYTILDKLGLQNIFAPSWEGVLEE